MKNYWDVRYSKGNSSGMGSVGKVRSLKWKIINEKTSLYQKSLLDYGCGDLSFWNYNFPNNVTYTGFDTSKIIIDRHKHAYKNDLSLLFTNDLKDVIKYKYDIIFCFDVLFHILDDFQYVNTLFLIAKSTRQYAFIYTWKNSPLRRTLRVPFTRYSIKTLFKTKTDNKYQKYRQFEYYLSIFSDSQLKLIDIISDQRIDNAGAMYIFEKQFNSQG